MGKWVVGHYYADNEKVTFCEVIFLKINRENVLYLNRFALHLQPQTRE
jgi:hypothetical protein